MAQNAVAYSQNAEKIQRTFTCNPSIEVVSDSFSIIKLNGLRFSSFAKEFGEPALPVVSEIIEIPNDAEVFVDVKAERYSTLKLKHPVFPQQPPVSKSFRGERKFVYSKNAYSENSFGMDELVNVEILGYARDKKYAKITVSPVKYNPAKKTVRVYENVNYEVKFKSSEKNKNKSENAIISSNTAPVFLIISDTMFRETLQPFVRFKAMQGYDVRTAYTAEIGKTSSTIKNYIQQLYDNANEINPAPEYLLLVGDVEEIPPHKEKTFALNGAHATDLYYATCTDGDYLPDIKYGRLSARRVNDLQAQIKKIIAMESITEISGKFLDSAVVYAGTDKITDGGFDKSHLNNQVKYEVSEYFNRDSGIYVTSYLSPDAGDKWNNIKNAIEQGVSIVLYTGHGSETSFVTPSSFNVGNVRLLSNAGKYPLVVGNCCLAGTFNRSADCLGEALMKNANGGAVTFVGASSETYFDEDFYWSVGVVPSISESETYTYENTGRSAFDKIFHTHGEPYSEQAHDVFEMMFWGNMAVEEGTTYPLMAQYYWEVYHVFGDPSFMPFRKRPLVLNAVFDKEVSLLDDVMQIQTEPYARVALSKNDTLLSSVLADKNGFAKLPIVAGDAGTAGISAGNATLCFTKQFYAQRIDTITFVVPDMAFVKLENIVLKESSNVVATTCDYGKEYMFSFDVCNINSQKQMNKVLLHLHSDNASVTVADSIVQWNEGNSDVAAINSGFKFRVSKDVKNNEVLSFTLTTIVNDSINQSFVLRYVAVAPEIFVAGKTVPVVEPSESTTSTFTLKNKGFATAENTVVTMSSSNDAILFGTSVFNLGNIAPNEEKIFSVPYTVGASVERFEVFDLIFDISSKNRLGKDTVFSHTSKDYESFDSGNFSFVEWVSNDNPWIIDSVNFYSEKFSAASAEIADNNVSQISFTADILTDDSIAFYYKTLSEKIIYAGSVYGDFLEFLIDGKIIDYWGGNIDWTRFSYPVKKGEHTFAWNYHKDESGIDFSDRVWIDDILLPIGSVASHHKTVVEQVLPVVQNGNRIVQMVSENGSLRLMFSIDKILSGRLYLVSVSGQKVLALAERESIPSGRSERVFDVSRLSSGVYICVFETAQGVVTCKVII
jgi:hypothetical protein